MAGMPAKTCPILPSADLAATAAFYAPLGFAQQGHWPQEYLILAGPDGIDLHFWHDPGVDRWTNSVGCWVGYPSAEEVRARHAQWAREPVPHPAKLTAPADNGRLVEFALIDLHGNLLRLGAPSTG